MTEVTAKVELKPCPFCRGHAVKCFCVDSPTRTRHWVLCRDCHACPGDKLTEAGAVNAWNQRDLRPDDALRETLCFLGKWIERGIFDDKISARDALLTMAHFPGMPWNSERWDVDHKPYAAAYYAKFPKTATLNERNPDHDK